MSRGTDTASFTVSVRPVVHVCTKKRGTAAVFERVAVAPAREEATIARELRDRELAAPFLDALRIAAESTPRQRGDVDVVAFLERDPVTAWRRHDLVGCGEAEVLLLVVAVRPGPT